MINRCPPCHPRNTVKPSPAYRLTITTSTSVKMNDPEFYKTIHQRIAGRFYTLDAIRPLAKTKG